MKHALVTYHHNCEDIMYTIADTLWSSCVTPIKKNLIKKNLDMHILF